jgi:outer membrane autotransporter protein
MRGVIGGFDGAITDTLTLGVSGGRAWPEITVDGKPDRGTSTLSHAGLYGGYQTNTTRIDAAFAYSQIHHDNSRLITDGVGLVSAASSHRGRGLAMQVEYGRTFDLGSGFTLEPGAGAQIGQMRFDGFAEGGGDVLSLVVPARTARSQRGLVGGRLGKSFNLFAGTRSMIEARAAWAHEFQPLDDVQLRFSGDPFANEFSLASPSNRRDAGVLGLSFAARAGSGFRFVLDLSGEVGGPSQIWGGTIGLIKTW